MQNDADEIKVSVITVCFNSEKTIERTIKSVLGQTYNNIEYIIVDGASTDSTLDIVNKYIEQGYAIIFSSEKDNGIYDAMNKGILKSSGEIISIINSDDWLEDDAIEQVVNEYDKLGRPKKAVIYGAIREFENDMERFSIFYNHEFLPEEMINHPASFVTKAVYDTYGMFDQSFKVAADYDFMLRLYYAERETGEKLFYPLKKILANFTIGGACSMPIAYLDRDRVYLKYGIISKKTFIKHKIVRGIKYFAKYR